MSITPVAPQTQPISQPSLLNTVLPKKGDRDGDETGGVDPKNEASKGATPQAAVGGANPNLGKVVNTTA